MPLATPEIEASIPKPHPILRNLSTLKSKIFAEKA